jgi:hypothetical protein
LPVRHLNPDRASADVREVSVNELVWNQGISDTRATLARWNEHPWATLRGWLFWSLLTAIGLLAAVFYVARMAQPDATPLIFPGVNADGTFGDVVHVLIRNLLVLALHALACVAGFMAGSSLPQQASARTGLSKLVYEKAGPLAIAFVCCATAFSLFTQADILGHSASTLSAHLGMSPALLIVGLLPHALPELTALFLPLAAWVIASRRNRWDELLAATCVTVAIALPVLVAASMIEIYGSPKLILLLAGH